MPPRLSMASAFPDVAFLLDAVARRPWMRAGRLVPRQYYATTEPPKLPARGDESVSSSFSHDELVGGPGSGVPTGTPPEAITAKATPGARAMRKHKTLETVEATSRAVLSRQGLKFPPPAVPVSRKTHHHHKRYEPLLDQMTKHIMQDGKLSKAQRHMAMVLNFLQTSPAPRTSRSRPLVPGSPPPSELPLDPLKYLQVAIDSVAPLIKVRSLKGMAGGGASLDVPVPLGIRQRRRAAIKWILEIVRKKQSTLSGRERFAHRLAQEIISIVQGNSPVWKLRQNVHKLGTTARANLNAPQLRLKGLQKQRHF